MKPLPFLTLAIVSAAYLAVLGWGWLPQPPSNEELAAYFGRINHASELMMEAPGIPWWVSEYLGGHSFAAVLSYIGAMPVYLLVGQFIEGSDAYKIGGLILLWLGALATYPFCSRWYGNRWAGFFGGLLFLTAAQPLLRLGWVEHLTIVGAYPFVPLAYYFLVEVAEEGRPRDAVLLGLSWSATLLCSSKIGATLAVGLAGFALILFFSRSRTRPTLARGFRWAAPTALLTGVLPLLPLMREFSFMTVFELDPFEAWQGIFSMKAATAWFDWGGELLRNSSPFLRVAEGGYYLGAVGILCCFLAVYLNWRVEPTTDRLVWNLRPLLATALLLFWLSFGPRSVLGGHFEFLAHAQALPHAAIVLHWLSLLGQGLLLWWLTPPIRFRPVLFVFVGAIYFLVPGFRLIEFLPGFGQLRAPDSFWILAGTVAWAGAAAGALTHLVTRFPAGGLRAALVIAFTVLLLADSSGSARRFFQGGLSRELFVDFRETLEFLQKSREPGRLLIYSSRYFYLQIPYLTDRGLITEAAHHNFMLQGMARLEKASHASLGALEQFLRTTGVSFLLVDRKDASMQQELVDALRERFTVALENDSFLLLRNSDSLAPAWTADQHLFIDGSQMKDYDRALTLAALDVLAILPPPEPLTPNGEPLPGPTTEETLQDKPTPFEPLPPGRLSRIAGDHLRVDLGDEEGTLVLMEAWHPDWKAYGSDGSKFPVLNCLGALLGAPVPRAVDYVEFRFEPPIWYDLAAYGALGFWGLFGGAALLAFIPPIGRRMGAFTAVHKPATPLRDQPIERKPIVHTLVVVPTYNEAENINRLIDAVLETRPGLQVLVVDDGSPDGTADVVRARPDFDERVRLMERPGKQGLGSAYLAGFTQGVQRGYDALIQIDADFSHDPKDISRLLAALDAGADIAIGSRYFKGVRVMNWSQDRLFLSTGASWYVRLLTGMPLSDATSGFKAIRTAALAHIDWSRFRAEGYGFQVELHYFLWRAGAIMQEVPIVFTERRGGHTKMTRAIAIEAAWRVLQLGLESLTPPDAED